MNVLLFLLIYTILLYWIREAGFARKREEKKSIVSLVLYFLNSLKKINLQETLVAICPNIFWIYKLFFFIYIISYLLIIY